LPIPSFVIFTQGVDIFRKKNLKEKIRRFLKDPQENINQM